MIAEDLRRGRGGLRRPTAIAEDLRGARGGLRRPTVVAEDRRSRRGAFAARGRLRRPTAIRRRIATLALGLLTAAVLAPGCEARTIELGIDAPREPGVSMPGDAKACRCRIIDCRVEGDCALIGTACAPDMFCIGDFGPCTSDAECRATVTSSACMRATDSTLPCE